MTKWREEILADGVRLINADCREVLPTLGKVDAVVADPPYGIGWEYKSYDDTEENWSDLFSFSVNWSVLNSKKSVFVCGNSMDRTRYALSLNPKWVIAWHKGSQGARCPIGFSDWEPVFIWGNGFGNDQKMHDFFSTAGHWPYAGEIDHACPKPTMWATWLIERISRGNDLVLDPMVGSGTTGVAAVKLGRKFIGIEIEPTYFDIACRRISEALKQPDFFIEKPAPAKQETLEL